MSIFLAYSGITPSVFRKIAGERSRVIRDVTGNNGTGDSGCFEGRLAWLSKNRHVMGQGDYALNRPGPVSRGSAKKGVRTGLPRSRIFPDTFFFSKGCT